MRTTIENLGLPKTSQEEWRLTDSKKLEITKEEAAEFYKVHQSKPFFDALCDYLSSGPIIVMILEGNDAIKKNREIMHFLK